MDNISRRQSNEDTTTSMYFDAESTMSTACYRTLETLSDISALSAVGMNNSVDQNKSVENQMNSTLEVDENSKNTSPLKTVKKMEIQNVKLTTPLRVLTKNILKEYKALCSTPARDQLLKTVDVTRGSDASRCVDLGLAFLGVEDEKPAYFPHIVPLHEENKENVLPDTEDVSTLSTCSSVEVTTTVIEKKMLSSISTVEDRNNIKNTEEDKALVNIVDEIFEVNSAIDVNEAFKNKNFEKSSKTKVNDDEYLGVIEESLETRRRDTSLVGDEISVDAVDQIMVTNKAFQTEENAKMKFNTGNLELIQTSSIDDIKSIGITKDSLEKQSNNTLLVKEMEIDKNSINKKLSKTKIGMLTGNVRRSVCEPNLLTNKPSRILNSDTKRRSFLPTCKKSALNVDAEIEIPLLMNRMLKITNTAMQTEEEKTRKEIAKNSSNTDKKLTGMPLMKERRSLLPSVTGNKRPFTFNQRMSVVVKTTLNSPARKIARKSTISNVSSLQRKSIIPQKNISADVSKIKKPEILTRKSMVPKFGNLKTLDSLQETSNKPTSIATQKKFLYPLAKTNEKDISLNEIISHKKTDISYTCNFCTENFRIKSLFDAHKRSHETDSKPLAFIKKPAIKTQPVRGSVFANPNQCKYCDKKFALLKALHIHLLQNCSKIPPSEKRKLQYTELNHVEKAQLPVFSHNSLLSITSSSVSSANDIPRYTLKQKITQSSSESLNDENKDIQQGASSLIKNVNGNNATTYQTVAQKTKKMTAHAGVYRTPSKSVPCHLCKLTFKSILDYTNHNLTTHGSNKANADGIYKPPKKNITSYNS